MGTHPIFESDFDCLTEMDVDPMFDENFLEMKTDSEKTPTEVSELSRAAPIDLAVRLTELYPAVNQRSTPIPTRWADNEDCFQHLSLKNGKTRGIQRQRSNS